MSNFLTRNDLQQTPLSLAITKGDQREVEKMLNEGAAVSTFVQGYLPDSLVCTLPQAVQPLSTGIQYIKRVIYWLICESTVFQHPPPLTGTDPAILTILDEAIDKWIRDMSLNKKVAIAPDVVDNGMTHASDDKPQIPATLNVSPTPR